MQDVKRLNGYFCDKEEEVVIWLQQLDEQLSSAETLRDRQLCHIGYIHLHGVHPKFMLYFSCSMRNLAAVRSVAPIASVTDRDHALFNNSALVQHSSVRV
jgi:hypothetical protein